MAVIPGGSHPVPDGAKKSGADLALIQNLTESDVRNQIKSQALLPWQSAHGSFFTNIIGSIGQALIQGITGVANTVGGWVNAFFTAGRKAAYGTASDGVIEDGQLSLSERTDLLSPLLNYGSAYCHTDDVNTAIMRGEGIFPFNRLLGYNYNVELAPGGGLVLGEKGTWNIECSVTTGKATRTDLATWVPATHITLYVDVLDTSGNVFTRAIKKMPCAINIVTILGVSNTLHVFPSSYDPKVTVQVPEAGYTVQVRAVRTGLLSNISLSWTGTEQYTRLTAQCVSVEYDKDTESAVPNETTAVGE